MFLCVYVYFFITRFLKKLYKSYSARKIILFSKIKDFFYLDDSLKKHLFIAHHHRFWFYLFNTDFYFWKTKKKPFTIRLNYNRNFKSFKNSSIIHNTLSAIHIFFIAKPTLYYLNANINKIFSLLIFIFFKINFNFREISIFFLDLIKRTFGEGFFYIRGLFIIFFIDACVTDDEPLWEPIEWSLVQTWILFIFIFAWIAENLITSRYGSYTGRDKRVWFAWYKSFWLIDMCYVISYALAAVFVIVPFYYELTYSLSFVYSWWNWYTRVFFFKFISIYTIVLLVAHLLQVNLRWLNWKKAFFFILIINFFIAYLLYTHFIMTFFGYFTDPLWYQKTRFIDFIQLSHEPLKWGWGPAKRDHFSYHKVSTVFWFKNDGPFAAAFLMIHVFLFFTLFMLYLYWVTLLRRVYTTKEISYTFTVFCISSLKQFFFFFFFFYIFIFMSFIVCYWRFPIEFLWLINSNSWFLNFLLILKDYPMFLLNIFFNVFCYLLKLQKFYLWALYLCLLWVAQSLLD